MVNDDIFTVEDTLVDEVFKDNPLVIGTPNIRFYAGYILKGPNNYPIGTFCIIDDKPRRMTSHEQKILKKLGGLVQEEIISNYNHNTAYIDQIYEDNKNYKRYFDSFYNLPNKNLLNKFFNHELEFNNKTDSLYLVFIDIKNINNLLLTLGCKKINEIIKKIVIELQKTTKYPSMYGLQSSNQILGVINFKDPKIKDSDIKETAQRWKKKFGSLLKNNKYKLEIMVYISKVNQDYLSLEDNITNFKLMQELPSKENIVIFDNEMRKIKERHELIERRLEQAIKNKNLIAYIQPKIKLKDSTERWNLYGGELLLRWHDEILGDVSPAEFIPIAEESNLINKISIYLIEVLESYNEALKNISTKTPLVFSINISAKQITPDHFYIKHLIEKMEKIKPNFRLTLEITETSYMSNFHLMEEVFRLIKPHHIDLSIDDFGTGYSSLKYISHGSFSKLKVDRTFVKNINNN